MHIVLPFNTAKETEYTYREIISAMKCRHPKVEVKIDDNLAVEIEGNELFVWYKKTVIGYAYTRNIKVKKYLKDKKIRIFVE